MDLIQKAKNLGCIIKNDEYYLWEIQKWLREVHNLFIKIDFFDDENLELGWDYAIYDLKNPFKGNNIDENPIVEYSSSGKDRHFKIYEEALEEGLYKALTLIL